ncbi:hypothetical protein EV141_0726 [Microcella putealis]|uniref:Uncharacterized protein n=1 Tax=Microcella putealis TaxID=337005 RepID=A0A4Q7M0B4_9MICO|nr:hypothetical protein [Microcella putealis]RZS59499.1 hypothetical protein EV141_0726 [Microcella putealis]TQM26612.1 hypothetical protein BJ957_0022 [Microcella putealis]
MEFSNREIAAGLLIALGVILLVALPKTRPAFLKGLVHVSKALFQWKLLLLFVLYFAYAVAIVAFAGTFGWWDTSLLSVTILAVLVTGLPIFMNAHNYKTGSDLIGKVVREVVGITALMITYLNLGEFPIWGELILQLLLMPIVALIAFTSHMPEARKFARFFEIVLGLIAIGLLISTTVTLMSDTRTFDWLYELRAFAVSVWLPIALIPFVYVAALLMQIELGLVRLRMHNKQLPPPIRVRLALILGLRGSLRNASRFSGLWITEMAAQRTFKGGLAFMKRYREAVKTRVAEQRARDRQLRERTGQRGFDDAGMWLDRREFYETRELLDDMWCTQTAVFRNRKQYVNEPFLLSSFHLKKLPKDHGVRIMLAKNNHAWYAWRETAGGYYFGSGGSKDVDAKWRYDGAEPPSGFPRPGLRGWVDLAVSEKSQEWATTRDQPIRTV